MVKMVGRRGRPRKTSCAQVFMPTWSMLNCGRLSQASSLQPAISFLFQVMTRLRADALSSAPCQFRLKERQGDQMFGRARAPLEAVATPGAPLQRLTDA